MSPEKHGPLSPEMILALRKAVQWHAIYAGARPLAGRVTANPGTLRSLQARGLVARTLDEEGRAVFRATLVGRRRYRTLVGKLTEVKRG